MTDISKLKNIFKNKELLTQALTHRSWINEHPGERESNERFEFLGDAILEFVVSESIFLFFPDKEEGFLTTLRASLVNTQSLANLAKKLGVGEAIYLSRGEEDGGGRDNPSLLSDCLEAIIGALYLDQGLAATQKFIGLNLLTDLKDKLKEPLKDPKSRLQELVQAKGFPTPRYKLISEEGPDHNKRFLVEVIIDGKSKGKGTGKNKSEAEQNSAKKALEIL